MQILRFTPDDAQRAYDAWGCNCGPAAIAAICGLTLDELRPNLGDFETKRYTNPTLMWAILSNIGARWSLKKPAVWPRHGLARIQWEGPWTMPGVPIRAAYRHTHWVGANASNPADIGVFDINAMGNGSGWCALADWESDVVPFIVEATPRASGRWFLTHAVEVERGS